MLWIYTINKFGINKAKNKKRNYKSKETDHKKGKR